MGWTVYNSDGQILQGSSTLADDAVTTAKILNLAVTNAKLADDAVGADELAANAVVNASIASSAAINFSKMENLTASRLLVSDGSGDVSVSSVTTTNLTDLTDSGATTLHSHAGGGPTEAAQSDMEDSGDANADRYVSPEVFQYHRGSAKAWVAIDSDGTKDASYNTTGTGRSSAGVYTWTFATDFSAVGQVVVASIQSAGGTNTFGHDTPAVGSVVIRVFSSGTAVDKDVDAVAYGDQ